MTDSAIAVVASACMVGGFLLDRFISPGRRELREHRRRQGDLAALLELLPFLRKFREDWEGEEERRTADGAVTLAERVPGVMEQLRGHGHAIEEIRRQVNGGGLGGQLTEVIDEQREVREFVADAARLLTTNQQRIEDHVDILDGKVSALDSKVTDRLFVLEETERTHRAALTEVGIDIDLPSPPHPPPSTLSPD